MDTELKPCPFCGHGVTLVYNGHAGHSPTGQEWWITCHNDACLYDNGVYSVKSASAAMLAWNARPIEDALRAELAALRAKWEGVPWAEFWNAIQTCVEAQSMTNNAWSGLDLRDAIAFLNANAPEADK